MALVKSFLWAVRALVSLGFIFLALNVFFGVNLFSPAILSPGGFALVFFFAVMTGMFMYY
jgi:hypothetical protein